MANDKCVREVGPEVAGSLDQKRVSALSGSGAAGVAHRMLWLAVVLPWLGGAVAGEAVPPVPPGSGQITVEPELFADPAPPTADPERSFTGQRTPDGKLVLTASNGFFDHGMLAEGESEPADAATGGDFIQNRNFGWIQGWRQAGSTMRWHLWIEHPGVIHLQSRVVVATEESGARLRYELGDTAHVLETSANEDSASPFHEPLSFEISEPGWHHVRITLEEPGTGHVGLVHGFDLWGPAAEEAMVLRNRWRPYASHARFRSSAVERPVLWVMSSRSVGNMESYSPITTPFGYFGTGFGNDGSVSPDANFSLWSYRRNQPTPQNQWSYLLAAGSPEAEFGSFGHEGSGVKLRGTWRPFDGYQEVTLALRAEETECGTRRRWFGYYLDHDTMRFRLYGAAVQRPHDEGSRLNLNPGSFVEQPGPPHRRRCGDRVRDVERRGWMLDENHNWHPVDRMNPGGQPGNIIARHWSDAGNGWFLTGMGGMPKRPLPEGEISIAREKLEIPEWLNEQAIEDLFHLPVRFGPRSYSGITGHSATVNLPLEIPNHDPAETITVTVFYGESDFLTFTRDLGYRETTSTFWEHSAGPFDVVHGDNELLLEGLPPASTVYLRYLVESPEGRFWTFETDSIETLSDS